MISSETGRFVQSSRPLTPVCGFCHYVCVVTISRHRSEPTKPTFNDRFPPESGRFRRAIWMSGNDPKATLGMFHYSRELG